MTDAAIAEAIRRLLSAKSAGASICPSEVARDLANDWRGLMPDIRRVAAGMPDIVATQGSDTVDAVTAKGPIRLRWVP